MNIKNLIKLALKNKTVDAQTITVKYLGKTQDALLIMPYGIMANIEDNVLSVIMVQEGNEDSLLAIPADIDNYDSTLKKGEVKFGIPAKKGRLYYQTNGNITLTDDNQNKMDMTSSEILLQTANLIEIKNNVSNLKAELQKIYTDINNLMSALNTLAGGNCVNGSPLTTASAFQTTLGTLQAMLLTDKNGVGLLLK